MTKEQVLNILHTGTWNKQGFNGTPLYAIDAASESGWFVKEFFDVGYTHFFYLFCKGKASYMYYDENDWTAIAEAYYRKVASVEQLQKMIDVYMARYEQWVTDTVYDANTLDGLSDKDLVDLAQKLFRRYVLSVGEAHAIEGITFGSEKMLRALLQEKGGITEQEFGTLCTPLYSSFLAEAQIQLWDIKNISDTNVRDEKINAFIKSFGWIENTYLGAKTFTHAEVMQRANAITAQPEIPNSQSIMQAKEAILKRFNLSSHERFIISTIEICFNWQDNRKKHILESIQVLGPVIIVLANRFNIPLAHLKSAAASEITLENLTNKDFIQTLTIRAEKSAWYATPSDTYVFTDDDAEFFLRGLEIYFEENIEEIKGLVANRGHVVGAVKICESVSDIDKIQVGEILVASMTRPEYLPAMQKAAAFITDEGGITCHAAIVAREMKKPCIIGTKHATRILKDGDRVEVDADKGIIKILK